MSSADRSLRVILEARKLMTPRELDALLPDLAERGVLLEQRARAVAAVRAAAA